MKDVYDWVHSLRELAKKIADGGGSYLAEKAQQVDWPKESPPLFQFGDENIDPFSFFYFFGQQTKRPEWRRRVYPSIEETFRLENKFPDPEEDKATFPHPPPHAPVLFFFVKGGELKDSNPELLWKVFRLVAKDEPETGGADFGDLFRQVLEIKGVGVSKFTQTLFLINPFHFFPADDANFKCLNLPGGEKAVKKEGWKAYKEMMEKIRADFLGCAFYEINLLFRVFSKTKGAGKDFFQVSTHVYGEDERDYWSDFNENNWVYTGGPGEGERFPEDGSDVPAPEKNAYPLLEPKHGDVVLVRGGPQEGKAIGVVDENEYRTKGLNKNSRIHVVWMNKVLGTRLWGRTSGTGFTKVDPNGETYKAFAETEAYKPAFNYIGENASDDGKAAAGVAEPTRSARSIKMKDHALNRILYGPPGTGKTWMTTYHALSIVEDETIEASEAKPWEEMKPRFDALRDAGQIEMVTFHQGFSYEDFIEGIKPVLGEDVSDGIEYKLRDGILKKIAARAEADCEKEYVLIIDEINRGNIAKIFGELITLVESSKRGGASDEARVTLPYSKEPFCLPRNLYLIGTMNTADRSIALLDTALRRRFEFIEMMPDPNHKGVSKDISGVNCQALLKAINQRIAVLLDREHQIGHTYFLGVDSVEKLKQTFQKKIIPLLQEYFYDNWEKIALVLNNNGFIESRKLDADLFLPTPLVDGGSSVYELLPFVDSKWGKVERYKSIYEKQSKPKDDENAQEP